MDWIWNKATALLSAHCIFLVKLLVLQYDIIGIQWTKIKKSCNGILGFFVPFENVIISIH